jgi:flagellar biosynthesis regulator FlaF
MTKKDTLFLLLPSAFLILIAVLALSCAPAFSFVPRIEQRRRQNFERFVAMVQSGELQPTKEKWIELLRGSREVGAEVATDLEKGNATLMRMLAAAILLGVLIQAYVIFRVKAGLRKTPS